MEENTVNPKVIEDNGKVNISDEVVLTIASIAATEVEGVYGMVSGVAGGIAELLGKKNLSKGVKITKTEDSVVLDLSIIVEYGAKIIDVAWKVQEKVKAEVETMTDFVIDQVNVSVDGVNLNTEAEKTEVETQPDTEE